MMPRGNWAWRLGCCGEAKDGKRTAFVPNGTEALYALAHHLTHCATLRLTGASGSDEVVPGA